MKSSSTPKSRGRILASSITVEGIYAAYGAVRVLEDVSTASKRPDRRAAWHQRQRQEHVHEIHHGLRDPARRQIIAHRGRAPRAPGLTTEEIVDLGIALVPEGRRLFPRLSVEENLLLGAFPQAPRAAQSQSRLCFDAFPVLSERRSQLAGSMSGGEQQMLALARADVAPRILLSTSLRLASPRCSSSRMIEKIKELKITITLPC